MKQLKYLNNQRSLEESQQKDISKQILCKEKSKSIIVFELIFIGITLIEVPYWWNKKHQNLAVTIYNQRPDLFSEKPQGSPIPLVPKASTSNEIIWKPELMTATEWDTSSSPSGWWMSEKYDGMRLFWNGSDFYSRQGNKIKVPDSMKLKMPSNVSLDGELWTQYGLYQSAVQLCMAKDENRWENAVFWVFDAPHLSSLPYEVCTLNSVMSLTLFKERVNNLKKMAEDNLLPSFVKIIDPIKCNSNISLYILYSNYFIR